MQLLTKSVWRFSFSCVALGLKTYLPSPTHLTFRTESECAVVGTFDVAQEAAM